MTAHALGAIARARGMAELAAKTGLTREGLYASLSKNGNPSLSTIMKVMKALGLKLSATVAQGLSQASIQIECVAF